MKTFHCDCGWSGHFPAWCRTERKDGAATIIRDVPICPAKDCGLKIKLKNIR